MSILCIYITLFFSVIYFGDIFVLFNITSKKVNGSSIMRIVATDTARSLLLYRSSLLSSTAEHSVNRLQIDNETTNRMKKTVRMFTFDISFSLLMKVQNQYSFVKNSFSSNRYVYINEHEADELVFFGIILSLFACVLLPLIVFISII